MDKERKDKMENRLNLLGELIIKGQEHLEIIKSALDECDKLSFFADVNRAQGKDQFASGIEFATKHVLDAMANTIKRYEKER